ncbi:MAG: SpoVA/SpoVAEb family sporulation membrane protein, partial [Oscillospiraceae bacterium]|nr:SpoVA/SpoVAEb family sporulation membrane protein [Oscillospiraceae bacterium]
MDWIKAFISGGLLCLIGQILIDYTKLTPARILTGYVVAGVVMSALGLYEPFVEFAGAGASVPLTGFGHLLADGVRDAVDENGLLGIFTGGISSAAGG